MLSFQPVNVDTGMEDENGLLIFRDGKLIAVAVRLESNSHAEMCGRWNIEAVFDGTRPPRLTFDTLDELAGWLGHGVIAWHSGQRPQGAPQANPA